MRLFVAVWPPAEVLDAIEALERPRLAGLRWTTRDQWHVTLRFFGRIDEVAPVRAALSRVTLPGDPEAPGPPVAVAGPATRRLGSSILALPVAGLEGLAASVVAATATLGEPPPGRPFSGHLTLAREGRGRRRGGVKGVGLAERPGAGGARGGGEPAEAGHRPRGLAGLAGRAFSATWEVSELTLVASTLHPHGARYDIVARYPLP